MTDSTTTPARRGIFGRVPAAVWIGGGLVLAAILAIGVGLYYTSTPKFLGGFHSYSRSLTTLEGSAHKGMACSQCHAGASGVGFRATQVADFYASMFGKPSSPMFTRLAKPTREQCIKCHSHDWSMNASKTEKVPHPAHLRVITEKRDCITCHRWIGHEETYMQQHTKMKFSTVCASFACHVGWKQPENCKNCHHQLQQSLGIWKQTHPEVVRANGPNGCLEKCHNGDQCRLCHTTGKTPVFPNTIAESTVTTIEVAHVKSDWLTQHGTFALQDQSKCLTCHVTLQECKDCHSHKPAFHGTDNTAWIGQHKNLAKDKKRCYACHEAAWCDACHKQFKEMR